MANTILSAFLEGFTGGNLFCRARRPGAATQVFADENSNYPQKALTQRLLALAEVKRTQAAEIHFAAGGSIASEGDVSVLPLFHAHAHPGLESLFVHDESGSISLWSEETRKRWERIGHKATAATVARKHFPERSHERS